MPSGVADFVCDRLIFLTFGHEWVPERVSIEGGADELLREPVTGALVHGPGGWLLLDTGLSETMRDAERATRLYRGGPPPELPDGDAVPGLLERCGIGIGDLAAVAISHLHVDHSGGLPLLTGVPIFIGEDELRFGLDVAGVDDGYGYIRSDYDSPDLDWRPIAGDVEIAPGVDALATPGHTPGHCSFRVCTTDGTTWLLAMDAIDLQKCIDTDTPIGSSSLPEGETQRRASHAKLMSLARAQRTRLLPGHCPVTWPKLPGPPAGVAL